MDKFGYYFAGGFKTYSKLEARQIGNATFHFNDEVFSSIDTTKEPNESLQELYFKRARQIRDKYDYVVLMYSGGSDSTNVLDSFLLSDTKFDEICTTWDYPTTGLSHSFHNAEITEVVLPRIKRLQDDGYKFKFREIDLTPITIHAVTIAEFEYYVNHHMSPNNIAKQMLRNNVEDWKKIIYSGKKLALVWGGEKPCLSVDNGKWSFYFTDALDNCVGPYTYLRSGWFDEMFYWTPDMPEIVVKQAHVVKNQCSELPSYDKLKTLIYPTWDPLTFCNGKSPSMIYSARDAFFLQGNVYVDRYNEIVESLFFQLNDGTPKDKRDKLWPMFTRKYEI